MWLYQYDQVIIIGKHYPIVRFNSKMREIYVCLSIIFVLSCTDGFLYVSITVANVTQCPCGGSCV